MEDRNNQSQQVRKCVLIGILAFIWLAALVFYWSVDPTSDQNRHLLVSILVSYLLLWSLVFLWSSTSKVETALRFLLTSASVTLTVGLLEVLALANIVDFRVTFGTPIYEPWAHPGNLMDPKLLHIHKPHDRLRWWGIDYRYDQHGLRNESDLEAASIIVIGDSFIEGIAVSAADLITSHLAKQLGLAVANLGQSWYGPQQELELLRRYGLQLHPKVCVWAFYEGNDLDDVRRYNEATRDWENFSKSFHSFRQRSFTRNGVLAVRRILDSVHHRGGTIGTSPGEMEKSGLFEASSGTKTRLYFWYPGYYLSAGDYKALEQLRSILSQAYQLCHSHGARFLVVFIPTNFRVYERFTEFDIDTQPYYWVVNDLPIKLEKIVREGLPQGKFLDLTPALTEQAKHGTLVYFPKDIHWSPEGHRVAATAIAQFLERWEKEEGWHLRAKGVTSESVAR